MGWDPKIYDSLEWLNNHRRENPNLAIQPNPDYDTWSDSKAFIKYTCQDLADLIKDGKVTTNQSLTSLKYVIGSETIIIGEDADCPVMLDINQAACLDIIRQHFVNLRDWDNKIIDFSCKNKSNKREFSFRARGCDGKLVRRKGSIAHIPKFLCRSCFPENEKNILLSGKPKFRKPDLRRENYNPLDGEIKRGRGTASRGFKKYKDW